ncbi:hypothetical protein [Serratia proteamaculans]
MSLTLVVVNFVNILRDMGSSSGDPTESVY